MPYRKARNRRQSLIGPRLSFDQSAKNRGEAMADDGAAVPLADLVQEQPTEWVGLNYCYASGEGVAGASYLVTDRGGAELARGTLDHNGHAIIDLPVGTGSVQYRFYDDPRPYAVMEPYRPRPNPYYRSPEVDLDAFVERSKDAISSMAEWVWGKTEAVVEAAAPSGKWVWGVLQGDFNEDTTMGQVVTRGVISMIPVVDQVMDVEDICAYLYLMIWKKRYDEWALWLGLTITLIGCVPVVGSAVKTVLKAIMKSAGKVDIPILFKLLNRIGEGNAFRYLKELKTKLPDYAQKAIEIFQQIMDAMESSLNKIKRFAPDALEDHIDDVIKTILRVSARSPETIKTVTENVLVVKLQEVIDGFQSYMNDGSTNTEHQVDQQKGPEEDRSVPPPEVEGKTEDDFMADAMAMP